MVRIDDADEFATLDPVVTNKHKQLQGPLKVVDPNYEALALLL
jgi:hypothetical protein